MTQILHVDMNSTPQLNYCVYPGPGLEALCALYR